MPESLERLAEQIALKYLNRGCYGKQYSDHALICEFCRLTSFLHDALAARDKAVEEAGGR